MTTAREIMHEGARCVGEHETLRAAAGMMRDLDVGKHLACEVFGGDGPLDAAGLAVPVDWVQLVGPGPAVIAGLDQPGVFIARCRRGWRCGSPAQSDPRATGATPSNPRYPTKV